MKYKVIINELKETADPNVLAFLKDVENKKRLSCKDRQYYLTRLHEPGVDEIIVNDHIPAIIRVAYSYSQKTKKLTFLDLVGEGVVGVYKFIENYKHRKGANDRLLRQYVIQAIQRVICKQECPLAFCSFDEEDPQLYKDAASDWALASRQNLKVKDVTANERNAYGVRVKRCCASCMFKDMTRATTTRYCTKKEHKVNPRDVCDLWKMDELFANLIPGAKTDNNNY